MEAKLKKIYYNPSALWKGVSAIKKLADSAKVSKSIAQEWLVKQPIWQIYLPAPKYIPRPKFDVTIPNQIHQADLLFMPHDKIRGKTYKYCLVVVDIASRYGDAVPLTTKYSSEVASGFSKIYKKSPLKFPKILQVDSGSEFKGEVTSLFAKNNAEIKRGIPNLHRSQSIVERRNKELAQRLFAGQYVEEIENPTKRSSKWIQELPHVVRAINDSNTALIDMKPSDAIKLDRVVSKPATPYKRPVGNAEKTLPQDVNVRYLYQPGELEGGGKRATDPVWSLKTYKIERVVNLSNQPKIYFLVNGPKRSFVREELLVVPV